MRAALDLTTMSADLSELHAALARGEFRAARAKDFHPYLPTLTNARQMLGLVRACLPEGLSAPKALAALSFIFTFEHGFAPFSFASDDEALLFPVFPRTTAAMLLADALLICSEEDLDALCARAQELEEG